MTTIVAVKSEKFGVAIGADTQLSFGSLALRGGMSDTTKLIPIHTLSGRTIFGVSGAYANRTPIELALKSEANKLQFNSVEATYNSVRLLHSALKKDHFLSASVEEGYESSHYDMLVATEFCIFGVYNLREVIEYKKYWAIGSGRDFALGALHSLYDDHCLPQALVQEAVVTACEFDVNSSLPHEFYSLS